jgi:hypothetical protein
MKATIFLLGGLILARPSFAMPTDDGLRRDTAFDVVVRDPADDSTDDPDMCCSTPQPYNICCTASCGVCEASIHCDVSGVPLHRRLAILPVRLLTSEAR